MMTQNGPGGRGSIPALVMRTGLIQPVNPANARRDITTQHVLDMTMWPTDHTPNAAFLPPPSMSPMPTATPIPAPPSPLTTSIAQTTTAVPPTAVQTSPAAIPPGTHSGRHHWHQQHHHNHPMIAEIRKLHPKAILHGVAETVELGEWSGRPLAKFEINSAPPAHGAHAAAAGLRRAAQALQQAGLGTLPPELVAGPLAALMRGGAIELHFQNGVVVRTAL